MDATAQQLYGDLGALRIQIGSDLDDDEGCVITKGSYLVGNVFLEKQGEDREQSGALNP